MKTKYCWCVIMLTACGSIKANLTERISQAEVDSVVDDRILLYHHPQHAERAIKHLQEKGATRQMLVTSLVAVLRRDMNAGLQDIGLAKADAAVYWLNQYAAPNDVANFVEVARKATNTLAVTAWRYYNAHVQDRSVAIAEGERLLNRAGMDVLHSCIWDDFDRETSPECKEQIAAVAKRMLLSSDVGNAYRADAILCRNQQEYAEGPQHRLLIRRLADDAVFAVRFPAASAKLKAVIREVKK